ncbi:kinase-like domain-containing protein [Pavlovales sp. CCMP2436]|nr:kinase-like domain-containing protein [Pavlovales sp. CCMP2436]
MLAAAAAANAAKALDRYHIMDKIGEGTYGEVFKAMDRNEKNRPVALKKIRLDMDDDGIPPTALREVSLLMELNHENVIRLLDVVQVPNSLYLVFDFIDTDLKKCMESSIGDFSLESVKSLLYQLLAGIAYCHGRRVLHRDLKPQNLLVDRTSGKLLIADFGLSRTFRLPNRSHTHEVVTLWYRAPEILLGSPHYNTAVDIWSCGCILGEMLTGKVGGEVEVGRGDGGREVEVGGGPDTCLGSSLFVGNQYN